MSAHPMQRAPHAHLPCNAAVYCNGRAATTSGGRRRQHVHVGKRATTCHVLCMPRVMLHGMPRGILHVASRWTVKGCMPGVMLYASRHLESARVRSPPPPQPGRFVRQRCRVQRPSHRLPPHERRPALAHLSSRSVLNAVTATAVGPLGLSGKRVIQRGLLCGGRMLQIARVMLHAFVLHRIPHRMRAKRTPQQTSARWHATSPAAKQTE